MFRKTLLINKRFQLTFILWMSGICGSVIAIFYAANLFFLKKYLNQGKAIGLPENHVFFLFLRDQFVEMNWIFAGASVATLLVVYGIGLVLSHRVAGPIKSMTDALRKVTNGKPLSKIRFRNKDYFPELADAYNDHLSAIQRDGNSKKK